MKIVNLDVKKREAKGSAQARRLRRAGKVPAVLYGHGMEPMSLEVTRRSLEATLHTKSGSNVIINLQMEESPLKEPTCLIKDVQHDPVSDQIRHVDFTVISMTEKITVSVPVEVKNSEEAPGVKEGGVLDVVHYKIEVECLPTQIPETITIDAKGMKINDSVHVRELVLPEGVTCTLDAEEVVIAIHQTRLEEKPAASEETPEGPAVIEKGKKPAEGEEAPAAKETKDAKK